MSLKARGGARPEKSSGTECPSPTRSERERSVGPMLEGTRAPESVGSGLPDPMLRPESLERLRASDLEWLHRSVGNRATGTLLRSALCQRAVQSRVGPPTDVSQVQRKVRIGDSVPGDAGEVREAAASGVTGPGRRLPYLDAIQRSFGSHDVRQVIAHTDGTAALGAQAVGAEAYTTGRHIAFQGRPSLRTAAHEAAHVIQQSRSIKLNGGVGREGDAYERHASEVARAVVEGRSAEALLDRVPPGSQGHAAELAPPGVAVQRLVCVGGNFLFQADQFEEFGDLTPEQKQTLTRWIHQEDWVYDFPDAHHVRDSFGRADEDQDRKRLSEVLGRPDDKGAFLSFGGHGASGDSKRPSEGKRTSLDSLLRSAPVQNKGGLTLSRRPSFRRLDSQGSLYDVPGTALHDDLRDRNEKRKPTVVRRPATDERGSKEGVEETANLIAVGLTISYRLRNGTIGNWTTKLPQGWNSGFPQYLRGVGLEAPGGEEEEEIEKKGAGSDEMAADDEPVAGVEEKMADEPGRGADEQALDEPVVERGVDFRALISSMLTIDEYDHFDSYQSEAHQGRWGNDRKKRKREEDDEGLNSMPLHKTSLTKRKPGGLAALFAHSETAMAADPKLDHFLRLQLRRFLKDVIGEKVGVTLLSVVLDADSFPNTVCTNACRPALLLAQRRLNGLVRAFFSKPERVRLSKTYQTDQRVSADVLFQGNNNPNHAKWTDTSNEPLLLDVQKGYTLELMASKLRAPDMRESLPGSERSDERKNKHKKQKLSPDVSSASTPLLANASPRALMRSVMDEKNKDFRDHIQSQLRSAAGDEKAVRQALSALSSQEMLALSKSYWEDIRLLLGYPGVLSVEEMRLIIYLILSVLTILQPMGKPSPSDRRDPGGGGTGGGLGGFTLGLAKLQSVS